MISWGFSLGSPVMSQTPSLGDCRQIEDTLARFDCYEQLEEGGEVIEPSNQGTTRANTVRTERTERTERPAASQGLPVIRRPNSAVIRTDNQEEAEQEQRETTAVIERGPESRPFYRRIWPFGGDDEGSDREEDVAAEAEQEVSSSDIDSFGLPNTRVQEGEDGKLELHDTVAAIEYLRPNMLQITLTSGQVWRQMEGKRYMLKEGDEVRIYTTIWGNNFRLSTERLKSYIQVARID